MPLGGRAGHFQFNLRGNHVESEQIDQYEHIVDGNGCSFIAPVGVF